MASEMVPATIAGLKAREIMTRAVHVLKDDQSLNDAVMYLLMNNIHGAPVVNGEGRLVGMFSLTDMIRLQAARMRWGDGAVLNEPTTVQNVMTPSVIAVRENSTLVDVTHVMLDHRIHRLPVLADPGGQLVGIVSDSDLIRVLLKALK